MKKFAIPIDRKSFHSFFLVSLMTFLAKMAIVLKEVVMAFRYGRQDELDAFLVAFLLPAFVGSLLANAMNSSFIPVYVQLAGKEASEIQPEGKQGHSAAEDLFAGIAALNLGAAGILTLLTFLSGYLFLPRVASGFSDQKWS